MDGGLPSRSRKKSALEHIHPMQDRLLQRADKEALLLQKARIQSSHPGFSKQLLRYDMDRNEWSVFDTLPFPSPVTTTAIRWNNSIVIPGGEIRAGVRTSQILIGEINR